MDAHCYSSNWLTSFQPPRLMLSLSLQRRLASLVAGCRPPVSHETSWISMVPVCGFNLFHPLGFTMVYGGREKYWGKGIQRRYFMGYNGKNNQNIMDNLMIYPTICDWYIKHIQTYTSWVAAKNNWHEFFKKIARLFQEQMPMPSVFFFSTRSSNIPMDKWLQRPDLWWCPYENGGFSIHLP